MELALRTAKARWLLLLGTVLLAGFVVLEAGRIWLASDLLDARKLNSIERAVRLLPGNADAWDRLGRFRQWDFANSDPGTAVQDYQTAVREEPESSYYWMDLASAYEQTGDISRAKEAYQRAEAVYPRSAEVAWHYGNFLLRQQENATAMAEIQRAVRADRLLLPLAISRVWVSSHDVNVLDQVLPPNTDAYFQALDFFGSIRDPESSLAVWRRLLSLGQPFSLSRSFPFLDQLIGADRAQDAQKVWEEAFQASGAGREDHADSSLINDGAFTRSFANGGLGWRWDAPLGASIDFDSPRIPNGTRSVRLDFGGGSNTDLDAPSQYVAVQPNRTYHFQGYLKTERITTESGPRFSIVDPHHPGAVNVTTENLTGTHPWTAADAEVSTSAVTHFLLVRLYRAPSRLFDNKLSGSVWMAELSLVPSENTEKVAEQ